MALVSIHANRTLRRRQLADGSWRGLEGYYSFHHGERPSWWRSTDGAVIGVFENIPNSESDALIIEPSQISVRPPTNETTRFADIRSFTPPVKEPLAHEIACLMRDGSTRRIPVRRRDGEIMDIYRFLLSARRECTDEGT